MYVLILVRVLYFIVSPSATAAVVLEDIREYDSVSCEHVGRWPRIVCMNFGSSSILRALPLPPSLTACTAPSLTRCHL
ncbi:hypothetical protein BC826DRAFT_507729 [Russula brevipes]|nr:hypothetical protein BC826DRAFT_507729 [Russula brevipes]